MSSATLCKYKHPHGRSTFSKSVETFTWQDKDQITYLKKKKKCEIHWWVSKCNTEQLILIYIYIYIYIYYFFALHNQQMAEFLQDLWFTFVKFVNEKLLFAGGFFAFYFFPVI